MGLCGLLNLNKPGGMTSRDAVNVVQRLLPRRTKIGHAGTLDPLASGVLVLCIGAATRLIDHVQRMPKRYTGTFLLGRRSPTEDVEGDVTELERPPIPTLDAVATAAESLVGEIQQRPPAYSAIKVQGRRAYDVARHGGSVELKPRPVTVYRLDVRDYAYPSLTLDVECGRGTYVRSLGRDLAESLGTSAVMSGLTRNAIGDFSVDQAVAPVSLDKATLAEHVLPALRAVPTLPRVVLSAEELAEIGHGRAIRRRSELPDVPEYAAVDSAGRLAAILVPRSTGLGPRHNLPVDDS